MDTQAILDSQLTLALQVKSLENVVTGQGVFIALMVIVFFIQTAGLLFLIGKVKK